MSTHLPLETLLANLADLPADMLLPLESTVPDKPTARLYLDLSSEAILTWYPHYVVQLTERRKAISVENIRLIATGRAQRRAPELVAADRAARRVKAAATA